MIINVCNYLWWYMYNLKYKCNFSIFCFFIYFFKFVAHVGTTYCGRFIRHYSMYSLALATVLSHYQPLKTNYGPHHTSTLTHLFVKVWKHWFSLVQQSHAALPPGEGGREGGWEEVRHRKWGVQGSGRWTAPPYLMWVAGRLSYCRDRKSSLWRSWCFCLSVSSASAGLSFSSSSSSARRQEIDAVEKLHRHRKKFSSLSGGAERRRAQQKVSRIGWI